MTLKTNDIVLLLNDVNDNLPAGIKLRVIKMGIINKQYALCLRHIDDGGGKSFIHVSNLEILKDTAESWNVMLDDNGHRVGFVDPDTFFKETNLTYHLYEPLKGE